MKVPANNLYLAICLGLLSILTVAGCAAGDRYNRSTGEYIDDKSLDSRVKDALRDNPEYKFDDVNVMTFKGNVQLSGFTDTYAQKHSADDIARHVPGVKNVENDITVKNGDSSEHVDDKTLVAHVDTALSNSDYKFEEVNVVAVNGTVQLSGFVNTSDQKTKAGEIARAVQGVRRVINNITVK